MIDESLISKFAIAFENMVSVYSTLVEAGFYLRQVLRIEFLSTIHSRLNLAIAFTTEGPMAFNAFDLRTSSTSFQEDRFILFLFAPRTQ